MYADLAQPKPKAHLIHGFNVFDGGLGTVGRLIPYLPDRYEPSMFVYGWKGLFTIWAGYNKILAKDLLNEVGIYDVVIGHSNGCAIIARALEAGMVCKQVVLIHPALDRDWEPPVDCGCQRIDVYYSSRDIATRAARLIPWHRWGGMGTYGPDSDSSIFHKHDDGFRHSEGFAVDPGFYVAMLDAG